MKLFPISFQCFSPRKYSGEITIISEHQTSVMSFGEAWEPALFPTADILNYADGSVIELWDLIMA